MHITTYVIMYSMLLPCTWIHSRVSIVGVFQDTRGDRQPSFTQMDLEMTFADQDTVMKLAEDLMITIFQEVCPNPALACAPA